MILLSRNALSPSFRPASRSSFGTTLRRMPVLVACAETEKVWPATRKKL